MKKNKALRIAMALLVVVAVTTCGMTGALAKYVDSFTATSNTVRAGLFRVAGPTSATQVFATELLDGDLSPETEAQAYAGLSGGGNNDQIIVPGSAIRVIGFSVVNYSEVDVEITFDAAGIDVSNAMSTVTLYYNITGTIDGTGDNIWKLAKPSVTDLAPASFTAGPNGGILLRSFPAGSGSGANQVTLKDFYILWPFTQNATGGPGLDGIGDAVSTDANDTIIGKAQATQLLTGGGTPAVYTHAGDCVPYPGAVNGIAPDVGCTTCTMTTPAVVGTDYADAKTSNIVSLSVVVNAVQVD